MTTMKLAKDQVRARLKQWRDGLSPEEAASVAAEIGRQLLDLHVYRVARSVCSYIGIGREVPTLDILRDCVTRKVAISAPVIVGPGRMVAKEIKKLDALPADPFGIPSPPEEAATVHSAEVVLVPGLAFSEDGKRLGRGGGYYDRFLSSFRHTHRVALAYEAQLVPDLPIENHDQRVDIIVTESRVIDCSTFR